MRNSCGASKDGDVLANIRAEVLIEIFDASFYSLRSRTTSVHKDIHYLEILDHVKVDDSLEFMLEMPATIRPPSVRALPLLFITN